MYSNKTTLSIKSGAPQMQRYLPPAPVEVCGDWVLEGVEECDDNNTVNGDGCDEFCRLELYFTCLPYGAGNLCIEDCGDPYDFGWHECDDGNYLPWDGCTNLCVEMDGYNCSGGLSTGPNDVCAEICQDGLHFWFFECDDGNDD